MSEADALFIRYAILPAATLVAMALYFCIREGVFRRRNYVGHPVIFIPVEMLIILLPMSFMLLMRIPGLNVLNLAYGNIASIASGPFWSMDHLENNAGLPLVAAFVLAFLHLRKGRIILMLSLFLWISFFLVGIWYYFEKPVIDSLSDDNWLGIRYSNRLYAPMMLDPFRAVVIVLCGLAGGFYMTGRRFSWWKYLAGFTALQYLALFVSIPFYLAAGKISEFLLFFLPMVGCAALLPVFPHHRNALRRSLGIRFAGDEEPEPAPKPFFQDLIERAMLVVVVAVLLVSAVINREEQRTIDKFTNGLPPVHRSPAMLNGIDILGPPFLRTTSPGGGNTQSRLDESPLTMPVTMLKSLTPSQLEQEVATIDRQALDEIFDQNQDIFGRIYNLRQADYMELPGEGINRNYNFLMVRQTARWLSIRAKVRIHEGDCQGALEDIQTIWTFGGMMREGTLVTVMIGTAVRGIGNDAAWQYMIGFQGNPDAMAALSHLLAEMKDQNRQSFPLDSISRHEIGFDHSPIVVFAPLGMPSYTRAVEIYYRNWMQYDQLRLATALHQYRNHHGEYPPNLESLVPEYIDRIPVEPLEGRPFHYWIDEDGDFRLDVPTILARPTSVYTGLPIPPKLADPTFQEKDFERRKAASQPPAPPTPVP